MAALRGRIILQVIYSQLQKHVAVLYSSHIIYNKKNGTFSNENFEMIYLDKSKIHKTFMTF